MNHRFVCLTAAAIILTTAATTAQPPRPRYASRIMIYDLDRKAATEVHQANVVWEAPNWSRDGKFLLANSEGKLFRIPVDGSAGFGMSRRT